MSYVPGIFRINDDAITTSGSYENEIGVSNLNFLHGCGFSYGTNDTAVVHKC
jgi:hypothetical protein